MREKSRSPTKPRKLSQAQWDGEPARAVAAGLRPLHRGRRSADDGARRPVAARSHRAAPAATAPPAPVDHLRQGGPDAGERAEAQQRTAYPSRSALRAAVRAGDYRRRRGARACLRAAHPRRHDPQLRRRAVVGNGDRHHGRLWRQVPGVRRRQGCRRGAHAYRNRAGRRAVRDRGQLLRRAAGGEGHDRAASQARPDRGRAHPRIAARRRRRFVISCACGSAGRGKGSRTPRTRARLAVPRSRRTRRAARRSRVRRRW